MISLIMRNPPPPNEYPGDAYDFDIMSVSLGDRDGLPLVILEKEGFEVPSEGGDFE